MEPNKNRPLFVTQVGNTTLKIRSSLPFMKPEDRGHWFEQHADLPEVKELQRVWIQMLYSIEEQERKSQTQGA